VQGCCHPGAPTPSPLPRSQVVHRPTGYRDEWGSAEPFHAPPPRDTALKSPSPDPAQHPDGYAPDYEPCGPVEGWMPGFGPDPEGNDWGGEPSRASLDAMFYGERGLALEEMVRQRARIGRGNRVNRRGLVAVWDKGRLDRDVPEASLPPSLDSSLPGALPPLYMSYVQWMCTP